MTTTKKGFLKAGSIISIIAAVLSALMSFIFISAATMIDEKFIIETYENEAGYAYFEDADGSYYIEYYEDEDDVILGVKQKVTDDEIQLIATASKTILIVLTVFVLGLSIAEFIIAILILNKLSKNESKKGLIIALLVLSIISGTMITSAFMIVALCLKDKPKATLENINEIATEQTVETEKPSNNNEE